MWKNTLFTEDNLHVMQGLDDKIIDLIYLDPPFNSKRLYDAPVGSKAAGASFNDMWTWDDVDEAYLEDMISNYPSLVQFIQSVGDIYNKNMKAYITYMSQRIIQMKRVLKDDGLIYLHCDSTASHYLKIIMDKIFGKSNFINEIYWKRVAVSGKGSQFKPKKFGSNTDIILSYSKSKDYYFNPFKILNDEEMKEKFPYGIKPKRYKLGTRLFRSPTAGDRPNLCFEWRGHKEQSSAGWALSKERLEEEYQKGNVVIKSNGKLERRVYEDDYVGEPIGNLWNDLENMSSNERTGYPTQKPLSLIKRIIETSSKPGDLVLDPFCGCATTCIAAQQLDRKWIGIDISATSARLVAERLDDDAGLFSDFVHLSQAPKRNNIKEIKITKNVRDKIYEIQKAKCNACSAEMELRNLELDHIIPRAKGGGDYFENFQLLCSSCNRVKGDRPMAYLKLKLEKMNEKMKYKISF
ncbi:MAG: hypothetical protein EVA56_03075 [alpha proteobacterium HIMB114]|nr:MAG: hypothetical protein EVA56_03075 [alpha proteobacterium HIMB114]|tara:strand:- start:4320 stop:5714 length:1395 start_codon:yes stop_codon:yes gene_type:complete